MDAIDAAQLREQRTRAEALEARAARLAAVPPMVGTCADCGEPIPPERRAAHPHAMRCVSCQADREGRARR